MKKLIIGFSRPKKWKLFAQLIMWRDNSDVSHAYTRFVSDRWGSSFIYHNAGTRTNFMGGDYFESINEIVEEYTLPVSDEVEAMLGRMCLSREGLPYGLKQVLGKSFGSLLALVFNFWPKNPLDKHTDCIEEQAYILEHALGIEVPLDMNSVSVKPYRNWVMQLPNVTKMPGGVCL